MNQFPYSYPTNSYESQPIYENSDCGSLDSGDSVKSQKSPIATPIAFGLNDEPPASPFAQPSPPIGFDSKMPVYPHSKGQNGHHYRKIDCAVKTTDSTRTMKQKIKISEILTQKCGIIYRNNICENVKCGDNVFSINYYIQQGVTKDSNRLMFHLERKPLSGMKRKGSPLHGGFPRKRRRLNNSQSQYLESDCNEEDHIDVKFTIHISGPSGKNAESKVHSCSFGSKSEDHLVDISSEWGPEDTSDPICCGKVNENAFQTLTIQELVNVFSRDKPTTKNSQFIQMWFELSVSGESSSTDSTDAAADTDSLIMRRPIVERRKITKFVGLRNEGATCYMNSMLQTLYHIASLRRNVYKIPVGHEASQKKKKIEEERAKKEAEQKDQSNHDAMSLCDDDDAATNSTAMTTSTVIHDDHDDDEDDDDDDIMKRPKSVKPPISLELQRLFYQLQTGAESNHRNELDLHIRSKSPTPDDTDNISECSVFTLKSDSHFASSDALSGNDSSTNQLNGNQSEDDDVDMAPNFDTNNSNNTNGGNHKNGSDHGKHKKNRNNSNSNIIDLEEPSVSPLEPNWRSTNDKAVSTQELIKSFGWSGGDAFVQHDVQEFLRVLMDKIESKVKATPAEKIVDKLFVGEYQSYVKCTKVEFESVRSENFQDIQLTIPKKTRHKNLNQRKRPFAYSSSNGGRNNRYGNSYGMKNSYGDHQRTKIPDIYDCIRKFIETERLDGDNQYYANDELKKQDADKGLRFTRFPPVLFLQLCRFEMDHHQNTNKIHDAVRFYEDIDLNPFIYVDSNKKEKHSKSKEQQKNGKFKGSKASKGSEIDTKEESRDDPVNELNGKSNGNRNGNKFRPNGHALNGENKENMERSEVIGMSDNESDDDEDGIKGTSDRSIRDSGDEWNPFYSHCPPDQSGGNFGYQLFSVLVHSGSTYGGHYFAYINPSGNQWYKFDDENVCVVDSKEATEDQFGGIGSRQSAYMLVYIQKKYAQQILKEVNEGDIPHELRQYFRAEKERAIQRRYEQIENMKKCTISYMNGHQILAQDLKMKKETEGEMTKNDTGNDAMESQTVNVLDLGLQRLLTKKKVYKDTMYRELMEEWSKEMLIPINHLTVYNFTERKNKTLRPNHHIKVDLKEEFKGDGAWTDDQIKRHLIDTKPEMKRIKSIHNRIGNVMEKKRSFIVLDDRRIKTLVGSQGGDKSVLIALKYFDILEQKLYFVDWLRLEKVNAITFSQIAKYIESELIPNTMASEDGCLHSLYALNAKISEFEKKSGGSSGQYKFKMFEEEAAYYTKRDLGGSNNLKVNALTISDTLNDDYYNGDIFVFQINPFHPYFSSLKPAKIDNLQNIVLDDNQQHQKLPMHFKCQKQEYEERGVFWYCDAEEFLKSLIAMTDIEIKVRLNTGWKQQWSRALIRQYLSRNSKEENALKNNVELKRRITRSRHRLRVEKRTTFGMIRKRLGSYYHIKPEHIEIWLPQRSFTNKWNYGSDGRGQWDRELADLIKGRVEWRDLCQLQFEIQTYNVNDFDKMTAFHTASIQRYRRSPQKFSPRIKELALFNLFFEIPSFPATPSRGLSMTVSNRKNWVAKELIQCILNQVIENPVFLFSFFGRITDYVRKNEIKDNGNGVDDIQIVRRLTPSRFLVVDTDNGDKFGAPTEYYMDDDYQMPSHFSQIKYTDFRVLFLRKNDPLILQNALQAKTEGKGGDEMEAEAKQEAVDNKAEKETEHQMTFALWTYIKRLGTNNKHNVVLRVVMQRGESFKDLILREIWPYLVVNKYASGPSSSPQKEVEETGNEREKLFNFINESYKFRIIGGQGNGKGIVLEGDVMIKPDIMGSLLPDMRLIVYLPKQKTDSRSSYHDRPLTIED